MKRFAVISIVVLLLIVVLNVIYFITREVAFHFASLALVIVFAALFGIFALHSNVEEQVVFKTAFKKVLSSRIRASMETIEVSKAISSSVEKELKKEFKDQYLKRRVFSLLDLRKVDCYVFLGGELKLYITLGMGKVVLRIEWGHRQAKKEARKLKKVLKRVEYSYKTSPEIKAMFD
jgi:hypothetical protein